MLLLKLLDPCLQLLSLLAVARGEVLKSVLDRLLRCARGRVRDPQQELIELGFRKDVFTDR